MPNKGMPGLLDYATPEPPPERPRARFPFRVAAFVLCLTCAAGTVGAIAVIAEGDWVPGCVLTAFAGFMAFTFGYAAVHG